MRSFAGRDILSLKEFERQEFFHVFDVARSEEHTSELQSR
jgi:aspartate carbamoyltransferase catalytic subunit